MGFSTERTRKVRSALPELSIVVPSYNEEASLRACVAELERAARDAVDSYEVIDGPKREKLFEIRRAVVDDIINITPLIRLGIGPAGLRVFKESWIGRGKELNIDGTIVNPESSFLVLHTSP